MAKSRRGKKRNDKGSKLVTKRQVKRLINANIETKMLNVYSGTFNALATPSLNAIANITQGITDAQRIGDTIKWKGIKIRLFPHNISTTLTNQYARFIIFQWHNSDVTTTPTVADILNLGVGGVQNYTSQYNWDTRHLYNIMYDRTFSLAKGDTDSANQYVSLPYLVPKWKQVQYSATTVFGTNQLYFIVCGSGAGTDTAQLFFTAMVTYTDA